MKRELTPSPDAVLTGLLPALILLHLVVAPYTKVEESFNLQAAHDVLVYGTPVTDVHRKLTGSYDHFTFPGAVPRSFIGALVLAGVSQPFVWLAGFRHAQFVVRLVLGLTNGAALVFFKHNVAKVYGEPTARWYVVLQAAQFHVLFYASRTLPNSFAFALSTVAAAFFLPSHNRRDRIPRQRLAIASLVFAAVIFRAEVGLLLAMHMACTFLDFTTKAAVLAERLAVPLAVAGAAALAVSLPIDSYFWQRPLWPELWAFWFNTVRGGASAWGTSPFYWYFTSALPRLLLNPVVLLLWTVATSQSSTVKAAYQLMIPNLLFVTLYSLLPHKEARFIFYVVPPLTVIAALGANYTVTRRVKSRFYRYVTYVLAASIPLTFAVSTAMLVFSSLNYPGGEALTALSRIIRDDPAAAAAVPVHADVLACMTGVTLFGTAAAAAGARLPTHHVGGPSASVVATPGGSGPAVSLALDRTEDEASLRDPAFWTRFDYVLVEDRAAVTGGTWDEVAIVEGYAGLEALGPAGRPAGADSSALVVGRGGALRRWRNTVRSVTGGWWVGPRMVPRIRILKRVKGVKGAEAAGKAAAS